MNAKIENSQLEKDISRVRAGEREAFRGVVDVCLPAVRSFVVSHSLPGIDVEDVIQRVFVEAYKNIADYKLGTNFNAWIVTIARYQLMMESTRLRRVADYHSKYVPEVLARQNQMQLELTDSEETRLRHLRECLEDVPESGRDVLRRRYELEQSTDEIAAALSRSGGAIRKQLCLLRQKLHLCVTRKLSMEAGNGQ